MNNHLKGFIFFLVILTVLGCGAIKLGSRMQYAIDTSNRLSKNQPAPKWNMHVGYHGADILRFVDDKRLLVGSVTFDVAGTPEYGPLIMYHMSGRSEQWRISRERNYAARHDLVALQPNLVIRSAYKGKIVHAAYDLNSGSTLWKNSIEDESLYAYRYSSTLDLTNLYVITDRILANIDMRTGKQQWRSEIPSGGIPGAKTEIISLDTVLVLVSARSVEAYRLQDGRHLWSRPNPVGEDFNVLSGSKGVFVYGGKKAVYFDETGEPGQQWRSAYGDIKLIAPYKDSTFIVTRGKNGKKDMLHAVASYKTKWVIPLPGNVMSPLLLKNNTLYLTTAPQEIERGERTFIGISIRHKKISFSIVFDSSPVLEETEYVPLPDKLISRGKLFLVVREQQGITAVNPKKKRVVWKQPLNSAVREENLCLLYRVAPELNNALRSKSGSSYAASNLRTSQSVMNIQVKYQHLQQSGYKLEERVILGGSAKATAASMQIQRNMAGVNMAIITVNAMADISNIFWKEFGESLIRKTNLAARMTAIMGIRIAEAQYQGALFENYFIPAPTETIMMVDLNTGKRTDLTATLAIRNVPGRAWSVALSPDESRLAVVGVGLDSAHYKKINRGMLEVPKSSLIVYDTRKLKFLKRREAPVYNVPKVAKAVNHPTAAAGASYLVDAGYPPLVAYAMSGSAEDIKKAIASGENVNAPYEAYGLTPLMAATSRGSVAMVKLLLDSGADVHAKSVYGKTAYNNLSKLKDKTARDKIKRLLDIAAKKQQ